MNTSRDRLGLNLTDRLGELDPQRAVEARNRRGGHQGAGHIGVRDANEHIEGAVNGRAAGPSEDTEPSAVPQRPLKAPGFIRDNGVLPDPRVGADKPTLGRTKCGSYEPILERAFCACS